jgi:hypothetical protein
MEGGTVSAVYCSKITTDFLHTLQVSRVELRTAKNVFNTN